MLRCISLLLVATLWLAACGRSSPEPHAAGPRTGAAPAPPHLSGRGSTVAPRSHPAPVAPRTSSPAIPDRRVCSVRVLDARGHPVAGAEVSHLHGRTVTDTGGTARVRLRPPDRDPRYWGEEWLMVAVRTEGFAEVRRRWHGDPAVVLVFRLHEEGLPVRGRCVGTDGRGVPGLALTLGDLRLRTDADGHFGTRNAPPRALPLAIVSPHWVARAQVVVAPATDVHVPVYRPARVLARIHDGAWSYLPTFEVTGGECRCRRGDFFEFRCVPGPVRIAWRGHELALLVVAEGEEREDVDLRCPADAPNPSPRSWVDVDFSELPAQPGGEAWGKWSDRGWVRLGSLGPKKVTRLTLPAPGLTRLRVRAHVVGIWEQPAEDGSHVLLRAPPLTTVRLTLVDASDGNVREGTVAVRAEGSPDLLASGWSFLAMGGPPEGSAWRRDRFLVCDLGPGTYDLVWLPPGARTPVCVYADLVIGPEGGMRDLGTLRLPPTRVLEVRVVDADGAAVSGAIVAAARPFAGAPQAARTGRAGIARLRLSDAGSLLLEATHAEGGRGTVRVEGAQASLAVTIRLQPRPTGR